MPYTVKIKQGDIFDEESATFIVNASNTKLILGSGVSMAFRHNCGYELQNELNIIVQNKELKKGDVVISSTQKAKQFSFALHAAIMDYSSGLDNPNKWPTLLDIENALYATEKYIEEYLLQNTNAKIVLPLMGCGIGSLNTEDVIKTYSSFFKKEKKLDCEVIIYGYHEEDYNLLKQYFPTFL